MKRGRYPDRETPLADTVHRRRWAVSVKTYAIAYAIAMELLSTTAAFARARDRMPGEVLAETVCARCHDVSNKPRSGRGGAGDAPPSFVQIAQDPKMTAAALYQFLRFPHGTMEYLFVTQEEADSLISYIQTLKPSTDAVPDNRPRSRTNHEGHLDKVSAEATVPRN